MKPEKKASQKWSVYVYVYRNVSVYCLDMSVCMSCMYICTEMCNCYCRVCAYVLTCVHVNVGVRVKPSRPNWGPKIAPK